MRYAIGRPIPLAPAEFDGTLRELYEHHIIGVLPESDEVARQHKHLVEYSRQSDPVFIVRALTSTKRGDVHVTSSGSRFRPSDNAPAWWMHFVAFNRLRTADIAEAPTHMFGARFRPNINTAGWHVAHIFNAKDRKTDWRSWSRQDLVRRFIRNVHLCNCFYVPKTDWQKFGGDARVIAFMAARYRERYGTVWNEFVALAAGQELAHEDGNVRSVYSVEDGGRSSNKVVAAFGNAASYRATRLCFRADVIEPLQDDDVFEVVTPEGRFRMTKAEFYRAFPGVVASRSYREGRIYHYPTTPRRAHQYRL